MSVNLENNQSLVIDCHVPIRLNRLG